jgi:hypothetical protein
MRRFLDAGLEEFVDLVETFDFTRTVTEVHLHHSWRPRQAEFLGRASLQDMWRDHTETQGWTDLAQHVTVDPATSTAPRPARAASTATIGPGPSW